MDDIRSVRRNSPQLMSVELIKTTYQDFGLYLSGEGTSKQVRRLLDPFGAKYESTRFGPFKGQNDLKSQN